MTDAGDVEVVSGLAVEAAMGSATGAPPPARRRRASLRENVELFVVAVVVALVIRHFAGEIFKIPTGSMAPTLLGAHRRVACPGCGWGIVVGDGNGMAECPLCDTRTEVPRQNPWGGHKVIANKLLYRLRDPRRWEVVVFRFWEPSEGRERNFIKRLWGLPGERIGIRGGDVYADGRILAKPWETQEAVWIPVADTRYERSGHPRWRSDTPGWTRREDGGWRHMSVGEGFSDLDLTFPSGSANVGDGLSYNHGLDGGDQSIVGDLKVSLRVAGEPGARLRVRIREHADLLDAELAFGDGACFLRHGIHGEPGDLWRREVLPALSARETHEVAFANYDDRLVLVVDGRVTRFEGRPATPTDARAGRVTLGGGGGALRLDRIRVFRDIHYRDVGDFAPRGEVRPEVTLQEGQYFFLGDNSGSSRDSRLWPHDREHDQGPFIMRGKIVGRAELSLLYLDTSLLRGTPWETFPRVRIAPVR